MQKYPKFFYSGFFFFCKITKNHQKIWWLLTKKNFNKLFSSHQDETFLWPKVPCQPHQLPFKALKFKNCVIFVQILVILTSLGAMGGPTKFFEAKILYIIKMKLWQKFCSNVIILGFQFLFRWKKAFFAKKTPLGLPCEFSHVTCQFLKELRLRDLKIGSRLWWGSHIGPR